LEDFFQIISKLHAISLPILIDFFYLLLVMVKLLLQVLIIHQTFFLLPHIMLSIHYVYHYIIFMLIIFVLQTIYVTKLIDQKMLK